MDGERFGPGWKVFAAFACFLSCSLFFFVDGARGFDSRLEGRFKTGSSLVFDSPSFHKDFDSELELRFGVLGNAGSFNEWNLDYELAADAKFADGPSEQATLREETDVDFFRGWLRLDNGRTKIRGGRQKILFGSGTIYRPLGLFDTRDVTGVVPETRGVDGVRLTHFFDETTSLEGWAVPGKLEDHVITGLRWESLIRGVEIGVVIQYHPETDLEDLADFGQERFQVGYHFKGEHEIGYWNESRMDIERIDGQHPLRFDTVFGVDYTFDIGEGLHVLLEYFLSTRDKNFTLTDLKRNRTLHQFGLLFDQPVGIDIRWQVFSLFDVRDGSFQMVPQIEYSVTDDIFLYLHGRWGNSFESGEKDGRLFRETADFNGTESIVGLTLVGYF
ncbi:MAG: hypothetical protein VX667_08940 [Nitrospinota bacterium]|nr:hypothetical protein [Nitrospinota bacterium]